MLRRWRSSSTCCGATVAGDSGDRLRDRLLGETAPALVDAGAHAVTVNVHDTPAAEAPPPVPTPDGEDPHVAEVVGLGGQLRPSPAVERARHRRRARQRPATWWSSRSTRTTARPRTAAARDWADGRAIARRAHGVAHPPTRRTRLRHVDRTLARHAVTVVGRAPAPVPVRPQRGGASAHRRGARRSTASSKRRGPRPDTWPTPCCSSTPTAIPPS